MGSDHVELCDISFSGHTRIEGWDILAETGHTASFQSLWGATSTRQHKPRDQTDDDASQTEPSPIRNVVCVYYRTGPVWLKRKRYQGLRGEFRYARCQSPQFRGRALRQFGQWRVKKRMAGDAGKRRIR